MDCAAPGISHTEQLTPWRCSGTCRFYTERAVPVRRTQGVNMSAQSGICHRGKSGSLVQGDFTRLAGDYARYRPGYAPVISRTFLAMTGRPASALHGADLGAGTGIWTRALAEYGVIMAAVEPNDAMREQGIQQSAGLNITWYGAPAEKTPLPEESFDFVCMASSFHWTEYTEAMREFARILKPGGLFMALWNTRRIETNPLLVEIENKLYALHPGMKRKSSGRSEFCEHLFDRLEKTPSFNSAVYLEARHTEEQTPEQYVGLWKSVNDVQAQLGESRFASFLEYVEEKTANLPQISAEYTTRAWVVRKNCRSS